ncbi:MAG TPA: glycosyltransferase [Micromonosporaceae bacterium]|jgi:GT2 family glycosyltransferase
MAEPISVVIPCHTMRDWRDLVRAVDSVFTQSMTPVEVVVAVDHNPDLFARAARAFPDAIVVSNAYARGASGNRNTGVEATSSPVVAMLDGDALARPAWLASLTEPLQDRSVVGTGGAIIPVWRGPRPAWFPDEFLWTVGGSFPTGSAHPTPARNVWSASMAVRRDVFDDVGGFRIGFGKTGKRARPEDTELCLRLAAASGGRWMYVPAAEVEHPVPRERTRFRAFISRCYAEGRGKVEMARLLAGSAAPALESERTYLRRTLPHAVGRGLAAAAHGEGVRHLAVAGATLFGVAAAGVGGGLEALRATASANVVPAAHELSVPEKAGVGS